jgi:hypothetical protein
MRCLIANAGTGDPYLTKKALTMRVGVAAQPAGGVCSPDAAPRDGDHRGQRVRRGSMGARTLVSSAMREFGRTLAAS